MLSTLLVAMALAATPATTAAEDAIPRADLAAYQAQLKGAAVEAFRGMATDCPDAKATIVSSERLTFTDQPTAMGFRERVKVSGCGKTAVENIQTGRLPGQTTWQMTAGLPGESLADIELQNSAMPQALQVAAQGLEPGCKGIRIGDVYVAARNGDVDFAAPGGEAPPPRAGRASLAFPPQFESRRAELDIPKAWAEVWPLELCGKVRMVEIIFVPFKEGHMSLWLIIPVWPMVEAHGPGARPAEAPPK